MNKNRIRLLLENLKLKNKSFKRCLLSEKEQRTLLKQILLQHWTVT